ncbi:MAG: aminomethyltransferase family protein, partial [Armatimonadota bacterium]
EEALGLPFFGLGLLSVAGVKCIVSRTGYTGEDGFELICEKESADTLWDRLLAISGVVPCGLGARDVLRIEAGYPLYGHEIHEGITPLEAGLAWVLKNPREFTGKKALAGRGSPSRRLTGLKAETRSVPRSGDVLEHDGYEVGRVTSGTFSPSLQAAIAMGYLPIHLLEEGTRVTVKSGSRSQTAVVTGLPFGNFGRAKRRKGQ